jgi:DHA2 family multidrug resistance protein
MSSASHPKPPVAALAVASLGAVIGATFPISVILSLGDVAAGFSASADDAAWITTVYNVGQLLGQPVVVSAAFALGRGRAMVLTGAAFTLSCLAVALAPGLGWAIAARLIQGMFGGALPTLMMLLVMTSPMGPRAKVKGMAAFALAASVGVGLAAWAAAASLAAGGWRGLFWVQAGLGALYVLLALRVLRGERGDLDSLRRADWPSFLLLSTGLGLLAVFLGEGERRFWFETWWITAALVCGLAGVAFAARSLLTAHDPLLRLGVFAKPTFTWAIVLQVVYRFGLMLAVVVVPQYLGRLQGYRVEQLAGALLPLAAATTAVIPIAYWASVKLDARLPLSLGLGLFATAAWLGRDLAPDWAAPQFLGPMLLAGAGQALFGVATLRFATFDIARHEGPTLGVVFNFARIFGLVGGVALVSHLIVEREKFHSARAVGGLSVVDPLVAQRLVGQAAAFAAWGPDPGQNQAAALAGLARAASAQAFTLAYADAFTILAGLLLAGAVLVWALPRLPAVPAPSVRPQLQSRP